MCAVQSVAVENVALLTMSSFGIMDLEQCPSMRDNCGLTDLRNNGGGQGEPGGTRAMGVCEPGQGGNAAAISNTFMCLGEPPRLSPISARESCCGTRSAAVVSVVARSDRKQQRLNGEQSWTR